MIEEIRGALLDADVDALVNAVNTVGAAVTSFLAVIAQRQGMPSDQSPS